MKNYFNNPFTSDPYKRAGYLNPYSNEDTEPKNANGWFASAKKVAPKQNDIINKVFENNSLQFKDSINTRDYKYNNHSNRSLSLPFSVPNIFESDVTLDNIDKWEKKHDRRNLMLRGALDIIDHYRVTKPIARTYEKVMDEKWLRELTFAFKSPKHFVAAADLFPLNSFDDKTLFNNISTDAKDLAMRYEDCFTERDKAYKEFYRIKHGQNAIRHVIWQAAITSKYGAEVARDAGDAHETRPYFDVGIRVYDNSSDADMATDLLNNKIGRQIGTKYKNKNTKEIALKVLEEFWRNGLYTYIEKDDGLWYVQKVKLTDNIFYPLYKKFLEYK